MKYQISKPWHEVPFLLKRDECSDAFGSDWSDNICSPSETLCCVQSGQDFPRCQVQLNKGWCCVGNSSTENCYVDQPSVCDTANSVPCTHLAEGVDEACCPPLTSCVDTYNATTSAIRCQILYSSLMLLDVSTPTPSTTSMSTISLVTSTLTSSTPSSSSTRAPVEATSSGGGYPPPQPKSIQSLSGGAIVGTIVGTAAGVVIAGAVAYYFLRRRWIAKYGVPNEPNSTSDKATVAPHDNANGMHPRQYIQPQELPQETGGTPFELPAGGWPRQEMYANRW
ncbi:hypothetical protein F4801DRAFT_592498 [Xylaria longipes]|nr:hypothetical protein F4801DRAFT_592498 [Xylaria longipes]